MATPYNRKLDFIQCLPRNRLFLGLFRATSEPSNKPLTYPQTSIHRGIQFRQQASGWLPQRAPLAIFTPIVLVLVPLLKFCVGGSCGMCSSAAGRLVIGRIAISMSTWAIGPLDLSRTRKIGLQKLSYSNPDLPCMPCCIYLVQC